MNVLQVNKFLWQFGGPERVMLELTTLLRERGHTVEFFAMEHERNLPSDNREYFVRNIDYRDESLGYRMRTMFRAAQQTIHSPESKRKMSSLLAARSYDLAHVHMIEHQISPSVLTALRNQGVPVVHTCHDHKLVCPESHLYSQAAGEVCERCVDHGSYYNVALRRCMRGSFSVSALAGLAQYIHRWSRIFEEAVDLFIAPSRFLSERLVRGGIPEGKIRILSNGLDMRHYVPSGSDDGYVLYFGRVSVEKGLATLVRCAQRLPHIPFKIVGDGPALPELLETVEREQMGNVEFLGRKEGEDLHELIDRASLTTLTSECHENCSMALLEAYAMGKPVVATRMGGTPENLDDGETGFLVEPADPQGLAATIERAMSDRKRLREMGVVARRKVEGISERYLEGTLDVYREAVALGSA